MFLPIRITSAMAWNPFFEDVYRKKIFNHLQKLSTDDRYLRFCSGISDQAIQNYVNSINFKNDGVVVIFDENEFDEDGKHIIIGLLHAGVLDNKEAEIGISVDANKRNKGIASSLFETGLIFARARGFNAIYMNCLYENKIMRHIVQKYGFDVDSDFQEVQARLKVGKDYVLQNSWLDATNNNIAIFDLAYRTKIHQARDWLKSLSV